MPEDPVVVDLFSGAGGASLGFAWADFEVRGAVDVDPDANEVYDDNLTDEYGIAPAPMEADLTETPFEEIRDHFDLDEGEVDVICGCPPCQNFSSLRDTEDWDEDEEGPKDELLRAFVNRIEEANPEMVFFENVEGILNSDGGVYVDWFKRRMDELGYELELRLVNAADYGVPQKRRRTIGLALKGVNEVPFPEPTHAEDPDADADREKWNTVEDAWEQVDLPELKRGEKYVDDEAHRARRHHDSTMEIIQAIPEDGGSRSDLPEELELECHEKVGTAAGNVYGRMSWEEPAPTLTTRCTTPSCGRFLHPEQDRAITYREAALLMGFPPGFALPDRNSTAERVVGNAVPPHLVESIVSRFEPSIRQRAKTSQ